MSENSRPIEQISVAIKVTGNASSGFTFDYAGDHFDTEGNFDFAVDALNGKSVKIDFAIAEDSVDGLRFKANGDDAFWIVEEVVVGPQGCPSGPYQGTQFKDCSTDAGGKRMHVTDINNDGKKYRYALRFDLDGETIMHDPEGSNGGPD
jgi:hypothetical protein